MDYLFEGLERYNSSYKKVMVAKISPKLLEVPVEEAIYKAKEIKEVEKVEEKQEEEGMEKVGGAEETE